MFFRENNRNKNPALRGGSMTYGWYEFLVVSSWLNDYAPGVPEHSVPAGNK